MKGCHIVSLFQNEPAGTFVDGHVFVNAPDLDQIRNSAAGYWHCDVSDDDRLTWSEKVYALFGLPTGTPVDRDWAVARYSEQSQASLERVRTHTLSRQLGFILDAVIHPEGEGDRWIRVLAIPELAQDTGQVVGLHGLKLPL